MNFVENIMTLIKLILKNDFDLVINFAAESHVDTSIYNPDVFIQTNVLE